MQKKFIQYFHIKLSFSILHSDYTKFDLFLLLQETKKQYLDEETYIVYSFYFSFTGFSGF